MSRILVFGATGYTGGLVIDSRVHRGLRPVLVGRRAAPLEELAAQYGGLETRTADVSRPDSVAQLLEPGDVLVTTVGPFERFGYPAAAAAVQKGAHYVDSTGEVGFVRELQRRFGSAAQDAGVTMLPAFGYDYVPGLLAGGMALADAPTASSRLRRAGRRMACCLRIRTGKTRLWR